MRDLIKKYSLLLLALSLSLSACKPEAIFEVNSENLYLVSADKDKLKNNKQFVAILYANLFQKALSANKQVEIEKLIQSVGDKVSIKEIIISNFLNESDVQVPSDDEMMADIDGFVEECYERFLVRPPTQAERTYFRNYILQNAPANTNERFAELIYFAFVLSDEYQYY